MDGRLSQVTEWNLPKSGILSGLADTAFAQLPDGAVPFMQHVYTCSSRAKSSPMASLGHRDFSILRFCK